LGILQKPLFNTEYPASVNFGSIGSVCAHELVHGFDTNGIQFNGFGKIDSWLDSESQKSFDQMAACVKGQYSKVSLFRVRLEFNSPDLKNLR
jgi:endothelin-converting enzyme